MKKTTILLVIASFFLSLSVNASSEIRVFVNGNRVELEQSPVIIDNRVLVPARGVFEAMDFYVDWNENTQTVLISNRIDEVIIDVRNGQVISIRNGIMAPLDVDVPAQIINGRIMLPLRALSEAVGASVGWNSENRVASITSHRRRPLPGERNMLAIPLPRFVAFFAVSENTVVEINTIREYNVTDSDVFSTWAELNNISNVTFVDSYLETNMVIHECGFSTAADYFVFHLSLSSEFEAYKNSEIGSLLMESLEKTFRSYRYFNTFKLHLV